MASPCVGLSQADLDALCQEDGIDSPPSPIDEDLYGAKRRRRITLSAMNSEIAEIAEISETPIESELAKVRQNALSMTTDPHQGGLAQTALDELQVTEEWHGGVRENSPVGSALRVLKRRRDSTGAGIEAMTARAIELATEAAPVPDDGGITQKELDEMSTFDQRRSESPETGCASEALSARRRRAFRQAESRVPSAPSPVKAPCHSPRRRRSSAAKRDAENVGIMIDAENTKINASGDPALLCAGVPPFPKGAIGKLPESPSRRALSQVNSCVR